MCRLIVEFAKDVNGLETVEYALMAALITAAVAAAVATLAGAVQARLAAATANIGGGG